MLIFQQIVEVKNIAVGYHFYLYNVILEKHFWNKRNLLFRYIYDRSQEYKHSQRQQLKYTHTLRKYNNGFCIYQYHKF